MFAGTFLFWFYGGSAHAVVSGEGILELFIARDRKGIYFSDVFPEIHAVFIIINSKDRDPLYLQSLAAIAQIVRTHDFEGQFMEDHDEKVIKDLALLAERSR